MMLGKEMIFPAFIEYWFSYGRIVVNALVNLITKIVSSPFDMLAGLAGGDVEGLGFVDKARGSHCRNQAFRKGSLKNNFTIIQPSFPDAD